MDSMPRIFELEFQLICPDKLGEYKVLGVGARYINNRAEIHAKLEEATTINMFANFASGAGGDGQDPWKKMQEADKVRLIH